MSNVLFHYVLLPENKVKSFLLLFDLFELFFRLFKRLFGASVFFLLLTLGSIYIYIYSLWSFHWIVQGSLLPAECLVYFLCLKLKKHFLLPRLFGLLFLLFDLKELWVALVRKTAPVQEFSGMENTEWGRPSKHTTDPGSTRLRTLLQQALWLNCANTKDFFCFLNRKNIRRNHLLKSLHFQIEEIHCYRLCCFLLQ